MPRNVSTQSGIMDSLQNLKINFLMCIGLLCSSSTLDWKQLLSGTEHIVVHFLSPEAPGKAAFYPMAFLNIFIDNLLVQPNNSDDKVCIGSFQINSFAYADDVMLLSTTVPDLQRLINICADYACYWKFRFGLSKSKCMVSGNYCFKNTPQWFLNGDKKQVVDSLEILGVTFDEVNTHMQSRISKCRRAFYSLLDVGMAYPGSCSRVKSYLWNTLCQPVLLYGSECLNISNQTLKNGERYC
jgi:hypothetical protein